MNEPSPFAVACNMIGLRVEDDQPASHDERARRVRLGIVFAAWLACRIGHMKPVEVDREIAPLLSRQAQTGTWLSWVGPINLEHSRILATFAGIYALSLKGSVPPPATDLIVRAAFHQFLLAIKPGTPYTTAARLITTPQHQELPR